MKKYPVTTKSLFFDSLKYSKFKNIYIVLVISLFGLQQLQAQSSIVNTTTYYIDEDVKDPLLIEKGLTTANLNNNSYQLFSHGAPGLLFMQGRWQTPQDIARWWQTNQNNKHINHLNIYGCNFAAGEKGKLAIAYLEKELSISIAASNDITGKNGNWLLEYGANNTSLALPEYTHSLQDNDLDGNPDITDIDDDNDGIVDTAESCVTTLINGSFEMEVGNSLTSLTGWTIDFANVDVGPYGPTDGSNSLDLNGSTTGSISQEVSSTINTAYQLSFDYGANGFLREMRVSITDVTTGIVIESQDFIKNPGVYSNAVLDFVASGANTRITFESLVGGNGGNFLDNVQLIPVGLCDTDGDGIPNHLDLDSDNDGISDLYESGDAAGIAADIAGNSNGTVEIGESADTVDGDGLMDVFTATTGTTPVNTDDPADGIPDYLDLDSDNDGIPDTVEARPTAGYAANDTDVSDDDTDGDGIIDLFDTNSTFGGTGASLMAPENTDGTDQVDFWYWICSHSL